ncbi:MAG: hypothetical protein HC890_04325 [Chloroflexaceae bacterium]|nr:hypothetical protein [Chloroflexaceae bacterium]
MFITSQELEAQSTVGAKSLERIYQNRLFAAGPSFTKNKRQLAIAVREDLIASQRRCLMVEYSNHITIWVEQP